MCYQAEVKCSQMPATDTETVMNEFLEHSVWRTCEEKMFMYMESSLRSQYLSLSWVRHTHIKHDRQTSE